MKQCEVNYTRDSLTMSGALNVEGIESPLDHNTRARITLDGREIAGIVAAWLNMQYTLHDATLPFVDIMIIVQSPQEGDGAFQQTVGIDRETLVRLIAEQAEVLSDGNVIIRNKEIADAVRAANNWRAPTKSFKSSTEAMNEEAGH
jgi:hypothetical protein